MGKQIVNTSGAPAAIGPYSQAVRVGQFLFASGQLGLDPVTGELRDGIEAQTRQALANMQAVLAAAGATTKDVVKTTIFLADMADFTVVNRIYAEVFGEEPPARSTVQVAALPKNGLIEIEMIAWVGD
ncbi:RidA family protein [Caldilinea sp.]|jgi:2-iminobutanoate/2-iminopropanoate deaminase|uniref:RidA family protein n=1 Tax=Caldilinea sp. TaxID=2293560 RepID=UPI0021DC03A2|nr:RidA family protein [Caldilinea sp.]GIV70639.1 MAG: reactive intermediate/imine deaminase [Caldilinea sp.]